ncbi:ABC transporter ATP-binding protein [Cumulibacter soli]|uniref:ABC transporter ATP-binding protein n=1 Tax=Cumulibacter soli TaxID=2546344 RepID=UPI001067E4C8|nr:ABC transporter ATP-binding protein [Cumulibacter soli]
MEHVFTPSPLDEYESDPDLVIDMRDVSVRRGQTTLLHDLSWQVELDERWVVLGRNGAGKTTTLQLAAAQMHPTSGSVHVLGERVGKVDVFELRPRIGLASAALNARVPPQEQVVDIVQSAGYSVIGRWRERYDSMDTDRALELLEQWGIARLANREYGTLSEGERKRTQICRALMTDPELLLLDEPAAGLDLTGREDLLGRLSEFAADPFAPAMVMVTHHVEEIPRGFTHLLMLREGGVVRQGLLEQEMNEQAIKDTFGLDVFLSQRRGRYFASIG